MDGSRLNTSADMFSLAAIYYQLLYRTPLFKGKDQKEVLLNNRFCQVVCGESELAGRGEVELLRGMLAD